MNRTLSIRKMTSFLRDAFSQRWLKGLDMDLNFNGGGDIKEAADLVLSSSHTIALTGAGISVDSGIPDFRSATGLWAKYDPFDYAHIESFKTDPHRVWTMIREMHALMEGKEPNPGHVSLAELEQMGLLQAVITQNIDNLHQDAGSGHVIEFHGNASRLICISCGKTYTKAEAQAMGDPPECPCGQVLKPDVVLFGEMIPAEALIDTQQVATQAELIIVAGTSAQVAPANMVPQIVLERGGRLIEINLETTHLSHDFGTLHLQGSTSEILPKLVEEIRRRQ